MIITKIREYSNEKKKTWILCLFVIIRGIDEYDYYK